MNRKKAQDYLFASQMKQINIAPNQIIDKIYDDFESRTCENCKYCTGGDEFVNGCSHEDIYSIYDDGSSVIAKDFGCNRWESKQT